MTEWLPIKIRIEITLLTVLSYVGIFFFGVGMCVMCGTIFGRMNKEIADCLVYVALGVSLHLYGQVIAEKKEKELKESKEAME